MKKGKATFTEKRKGPDFFIKSLKWISVTGLTLLFFALLIFEKAKPESQNFYSRFYNLGPLNENWDTTLTMVIFVIMLISFLLSFFGIFINRQRHNRKTDENWVSLYFIAAISLISILIYIF